MMKKLLVRVVIGLCFIPFFSIWSFLFSLYVFFLVLMFVVKGELWKDRISYLILIEGTLMLLDWVVEIMEEKGIIKNDVIGTDRENLGRA